LEGKREWDKEEKLLLPLHSDEERDGGNVKKAGPEGTVSRGKEPGCSKASMGFEGKCGRRRCGWWWGGKGTTSAQSKPTIWK